MSGQPNQGTPSRFSKTSPISGKQGPLKATIPMCSLIKQSSSRKTENSTTVSPTYYWRRNSPDHTSGQRSPGSSAYKGKSKNHGPDGSFIRRTASLDTLFLKGQWPRDTFFWQIGTLQIDKSTQTYDPDWTDLPVTTSTFETEGKLDKLSIRPKSRGTKDSNSRYGSPGENTLNSSSQTLTCPLSQTYKINPHSIPLKPLPKSSIRSSVEGLNQEIERIVLKTDRECYSSRTEDQVTPEGHRAPLAELLRSTRSCSVNTQTPQDFGSCSSQSSGESLGSSPDQDASKLGSSPHINKFLAREPPDGCEKIKSLDSKRSLILDIPQPPCTFKLKPSLGSAFQLLQPNISETVDQDSPLVPPEQGDVN